VSNSRTGNAEALELFDRYVQKEFAAIVFSHVGKLGMTYRHMLFITFPIWWLLGDLIPVAATLNFDLAARWLAEYVMFALLIAPSAMMITLELCACQQRCVIWDQCTSKTHRLWRDLVLNLCSCLYSCLAFIILWVMMQFTSRKISMH